jgi:hypothetical protein
MGAVSGALFLAAIIAGVVLAATMRPKGGEGSDMSPHGLDDFQMNQNSEGQAVPWICGKVRLTTNILWYGNLRTEAVYEKAGGKGFKTKKQLTGFNYYMDIWHSLCQGPDVTLHSVYIQDDPRDLSDLGTYTFNSGDDGTFPTEPGQYASPITGVAHLFLDGYFLGTNVNQVPTMHFIVSRTSTAPVTYANETNGMNPAAVIYDLLIEAGVLAGDIDINSFEEASVYWHNEGYALNMIFNKQAEVRDHINKVFTYVDGSLRTDENDKYVLKAYRDSDTSSDTINTEDFKKFQFKRRAWDDVSSDFRANYVDENSDYSTRTLRVRNPAVRSLIGHNTQKSMDLTAFRDSDTASKRLWDIMKKFSYPEAQVQCTVGIEFSGLNVGDIVTLNHTDYEISSAEFRITNKSMPNLDNNEVEFDMTQELSGLFDDSYGDAGTTSWVAPDYTPVALPYERVIELPYTETYGTNPAFLCLGARAGQEDGFSVMFSPDGTDYVTHAVVEDFAQYGTLAENYTDDTDAIDDDIGILFTPYRDDPSFDDISRISLFTTLRVGVLYNTSTGAFELFGFQTITPEGASDYRLTGVIRGILNTDRVSWSTGTTEVWLTTMGSNIVSNLTATDFYLKLVPYSQYDEVAIGSVSAINVVGTNKASTPWPPALIEVAKTGASNAVTVTPTTRVFLGAGTRDGVEQTDQDPPEFEGTFQWYTSVSATINTVDPASHQFTVTQAGAFTLYVRSQVSGLWSAWQSVSVGASDDTYYGPEA